LGIERKLTIGDQDCGQISTDMDIPAKNRKLTLFFSSRSNLLLGGRALTQLTGVRP
jgi:hypothetical protein